MNKPKALKSFWSSFGLKAYNELTVPADAQMPYITYEQMTSDFDRSVTLTASLWYKGTTWDAVNDKASEIENAIGRGGIFKNFEDGSIWVTLGSPFAQSMGDEIDSMARRIVLNINAEFIPAE